MATWCSRGVIRQVQSKGLHGSGLWPMVRRKAVSSATRLYGASGTRYVTMRGLTGSPRVPSG
eukprot:654961-Prymnesium_polylepis.1